MFETAVVHAQTQAPERRVGLLTASVGIHTLAGAAIIIASIQSLTLPTHAPNQMSTFSWPVIEIPRQIGDPHGSVQVKRPQPAQPARTITAPADAAPQVIPLFQAGDLRGEFVNRVDAFFRREAAVGSAAMHD